MTEVSPRQIAKNTTALAIANVSNLIGSFALTFFVARRLGITGFGVYSTVFIFYSVTSIFSALGLSNYLIRELARDLSLVNRYFVHGSLIALTASTTIALGLWILVAFTGYAPETIAGIRVIALSLPPTSLIVVLEAVFVTFQRTEFVTLTSVIEAGGRILVSLLLLFSGHGALALIAVFVIFRYVAMGAGIVLTVQHIHKPHWEYQPSFLVRILRELWTFSLLLILTGTFEQIEVVLLSILHGEAAVGIYSAALKLVTLWDVIPLNYMRTIFPLMSRVHKESDERFGSLQNRSAKYLLALALPLLVGTTVCADSIVRLFYGEGYDRSVAVLRILGFFILPLFVQHIPWRVLLARDRQDLALRAQITSIVVRIILSVLLVPRYSYIGTALTLVMALIADNVIHIYYLQKASTEIRFAQIAWRFVLASGGMGIIAFAANQFLALPLTVTLGGLAYGVLVLVFRALSREDYALLKRVWRPSVPDRQCKTADS